MNGILLSLLSYLAGDLVAAVLARFGIRGFAPPAAQRATLVQSALDRLLSRADRDLPDAELGQHVRDREIVKTASKDWFA